MGRRSPSSRRMRSMQKSYTPFVLKSRGKRSEAVIRLKNKMRKDVAMFGGSYTSHLYLEDDTDRPSVFCHDFDFYFPGESRFVLWNADIVTATSKFWGEVDSLAWDKAYGMLSEEEAEEEFKLDFVQIEGTYGKSKLFRFADKEEKKYEQFDGLTYSEYKRNLESDIIKNSPPEIFESFMTDRKFAYGIGLNIVVDEPTINHEVILKTIERFKDMGEVNWRSSTPVARDRLPMKTQRELMIEEQAPGVLMGRPVRMDY